MEEDNGAPSGRSSPRTPKKVKLESEEPKELLKAEDHSEDESEEIEQDEDEEEDGSPQLPPLLDMIDLPPASTLPPTPPLPSSPRDLNMEQQDSEDEGPPPGWDNTYQLQEQVEHMLTPAAVSAISSDISDIRMEDVQQDGWNGEDAAPELIASDTKVEEQDSEDEGPPPGWDSKSLPETELQVAYPQITQSDTKTEDLQEDVRNGNGATAALELVPSDMKVEEQDSEEDEGPPPGWDSKCQPEPELQTPFPAPTITQSDMKTEEVQQDAPQPQLVLVPSDMKGEEQDSEEDEGPPPGWDSKCQPQHESTDKQTEDAQQGAWNGQHPTPQPQLVLSDVKVEEQDSEEDEGPPPGWDSKSHPQPESTDIKTTEEIQHKAQNGDGPQPQQPNHSPAPALEVAPSAITVEEQDSEADEGPPPGWDSKCTPPSESKIEDDQQQQQQEDEDGQGWGSSSTPTPQPPPHSIGERMGLELEQKQKNVEAAVAVEPERPQPQPPSRQQPPCPSTTTKKTNNHIPEMGQMVCGSCRRLLSYPKGARYVECGCCLEENYVLEEHEVGQVICGGCDVLLMYPYGAPKVRCVNCSTETEIGDQNRRPPLSEQQRRARRHLKRVQTGFKY
ncbi:unnamed protein product [Lactuca saligna]|uniref:Zinc finger LSD1-type domain-containing protein n=1 Tax=Lactuca saligna TaxID=75948 RepID=A0AA35ZHJ5_LACSI|nr:unnamed protein product [Lactuca saligna]